MPCSTSTTLSTSCPYPLIHVITTLLHYSLSFPPLFLLVWSAALPRTAHAYCFPSHALFCVTTHALACGMTWAAELFGKRPLPRLFNLRPSSQFDASTAVFSSTTFLPLACVWARDFLLIPTVQRPAPRPDIGALLQGSRPNIHMNRTMEA